MKRIVSVILIISLFLTTVPCSVFATNGLTQISVFQDELCEYSVVFTEDEILFSGEDLSTITGYSYEIKGKNAYFLRGEKQLRVNVRTDTLYPMENVVKLNDVRLNSDIQKIGDKYYFPASQMFPWMNVTCMEQDGVLFILADEVSIWDLYEEFEPDEFLFDFVDCCKELEVNSKWVKAAAYVKDKGIKSGLDLVYVDYGVSVGGYQDYYDVFDEMFQNKESSIYAFKELTDISNNIKSCFDVIELVEELDNLPEELQVISGISDKISGLSNAADIAVYINTFQEDNVEKINAMNSITLNSHNYEFPEEMVFAASMVRDGYSDWWTGVEHRLVNIALDETIEAMAKKASKLFDAALKIAGLSSAISSDWATAVNRIDLYETISSCSGNFYKKEMHTTWRSTIDSLRGQAILYLYANEQSYRAMAAYAQKEGNTSLTSKYLEKAERALEWQGKFLASANATENDSHEYGSGIAKQAYTEELLDMFRNVAKGGVSGDAFLTDNNKNEQEPSPPVMPENVSPEPIPSQTPIPSSTPTPVVTPEPEVIDETWIRTILSSLGGAEFESISTVSDEDIAEFTATLVDIPYICYNTEDYIPFGVYEGNNGRSYQVDLSNFYAATSNIYNRSISYEQLAGYTISNALFQDINENYVFLLANNGRGGYSEVIIQEALEKGKQIEVKYILNEYGLPDSYWNNAPTDVNEYSAVLQKNSGNTAYPYQIQSNIMTSSQENTTVVSTKYIVNVANSAYFRSSPEEIEGNILATIPLNEPVGFIEETNSLFSRVEHNGEYGYVKSEYLGVSPSISERESNTLWIDGYTEILQSYVGTDSKFQLTDLNMDGIPELLVAEGWFHAAGVAIYTNHQGAAIEAGRVGSFGMFSYSPGTEVIVSNYSGMGATMNQFYRLSNGTLQFMCSIDSYQDLADETLRKYEIDDREVSQAEYEKELSRLLDAGAFYDVGYDTGWTVNAENVESLIDNYMKFVWTPSESGTSGSYPTDELGRMAQDYYERHNGEYPSEVEVAVNGDGSYTIHLFDWIENGGEAHTATYAWYTVDGNGVGMDTIFMTEIDLNT